MSDDSTRRLLIVDDDPRILASLSKALADDATTAHTARSAEEALGVLAREGADLVLTDLRMPGMDGLEFLRLLRDRRRELDVVLMTAFDELPLVAEAMKEGAADFLVKPLDLHKLREVVGRILSDRAARTGVVPYATTPTASPSAQPNGLVGRDPRMVELFKVVGQVAASSATVLIRGESGTGKELVARQIHRSSPRRAEPFVAVNCTALPATLLESELFGHVKGAFTGAAADRRGRFAQAGKGTLFLDEIGDTSVEFQAKLLRVLQEHEFHPVGGDRPVRAEARVIAATHRDLEALVANGAFREDLYYRLRVVELVVPPLRERLGDVPLLADHILGRACAEAGRRPAVLSDEARLQLVAHHWPGNVRELENCLTRAVLITTGDVIRPEHIALRTPSPAGEDSGEPLLSLEDVEAAQVARVLRATRGQKKRAAEVLGVSRPRLDRLIVKYGLEELAGRGAEA